ncbi:MAG: AAA-like domain-containing protein [Candidatus Aminicenantes bacterium]|nr:AAA-like domain-containing protein [Candidatus Aminicenantes bacterium]
MRKCFISYRHVKPDEDLAHFLEKFLNQNGHKVFVDTQILVGTKWAKEIEKQIKSSDSFIILLSKDSIRSDMVRQEVVLAHTLSQERGEQFIILPIRVDFKGELPYDLGAYLDSIQYALWTHSTTPDTIAGQILAAMEKHEFLPIKRKANDESASTEGIKDLYEVTDGIGAPLPAADPRFATWVELETGIVRLDSPFYAKRQADEDVMNQIRKTGSTTILKGSRQMGKSSLLARAHAEAKNLQMHSCYLDFQFIDKSHLTSLDTLFRYLAHKICREFKTALKPDECWDTFLGAKDNLTDFIGVALLKEAGAPVLLLLDEVDRLFDCPFRDDFFATIRGWHNLRATEESWNKLNLVIAHSTEPYLWIQDINQSPFNVGLPVQLEDFDFHQVSELNSKHGDPLKTDDEIKESMDLTGGQPFLVRLALYMLKKDNYSISQLKKVATDDRGPFGDHLRRFAWRLQAEKEVKKSLQQILDKGACDKEEHFLRLRAGGLVKGETRHDVHMRCQLYYDYFKEHL